MLVPVANLHLSNVCAITSVSVVQLDRTVWSYSPTGPYYVKITYKGNKVNGWGIASKQLFTIGFKNKSTAQKEAAAFSKNINKLCKK